MNTLAERLSYLMTQTGTTITKLQDVAGVSYEMARRYTLGTATPRDNKVEKIAEYFQVSPSYLKYGQGKAPEKTTTLSTELVTTQQDNEHRHRIDYLDVYLAAGISGIENSDYPEIISTLFLSDEGMARFVGKRSSQGVSIVNVPTDSMEPTIRKGDIVFIDTTINCYIGDGIYAFSINGELYIKRIQKLMSGGYRMISDNQAYPPEIISDEIYASAQFVGKFIRTVHIDVMNL